MRVDIYQGSKVIEQGDLVYYDGRYFLILFDSNNGTYRICNALTSDLTGGFKFLTEIESYFGHKGYTVIKSKNLVLNYEV